MELVEADDLMWKVALMMAEAVAKVGQMELTAEVQADKVGLKVFVSVDWQIQQEQWM